jgi:hypothetical protein
MNVYALHALKKKKKLNLVLTEYLVCLCVRSAGSAVTGASCGGADGGGDGEGVGELAAATAWGASVAKKQSKVFDARGEM